MPVITVRHVTTYRYQQPVAFGEHRMMLRPRDSYDQRLLDSKLVIRPEPADIRWVHDVFGNCVAIARFSGRSDELRFESVIRLDHSATNALDFQIEEYATRYPFTYGADEMPDLLRLIERQYLDPEHEIDRWAGQFLRHDGRSDTSELLAAMTHAIRREMVYEAREESGIQDPVKTLRIGSGSCRDFAVLMMEAVRSLGLAARFVSGYLYVPEGRLRHRVGGGATHAWLEVYLPGGGWVEFDPTNGIVGNHDLVRVAVVRDPRQAVPISGSWIGFPSDHLGMTVEVEVTAEAKPGDAPEAVPERRSQANG
ncbi:MAG TPA: transglutaminase family protein [Stellaceae bacterium]|nr:transglutaminase family protein [Stellaceae bacterium]